MTILAVGIMLFAIFQIATSVMVPSYGGVVVGLIMFGAANAMVTVGLIKINAEDGNESIDSAG